MLIQPKLYVISYYRFLPPCSRLLPPRQPTKRNRMSAQYYRNNARQWNREQDFTNRPELIHLFRVEDIFYFAQDLSANLIYRC